MEMLPRNIKILLVIETASGGSGRHFIDLARGLINYGYYVHAVYSPSRSEESFVRELQTSGVQKITGIRMQRSVGWSDLRSAIQLRRLIHREGPFDIVHSHSSKAGALMRIVAPAKSVKIYTPHAFKTMDPALGRINRYIYGAIEAVLGRFCSDGIILVSKYEFKHALQLKIPCSKLFLVYNGINSRSNDDSRDLRREFNIHSDSIVVGFIGRLSPQKNPIRFVEAIKIAAGRNDRICGVVIGDGELFSEVRQASNSRLILLGSRNAQNYIAGFNMLVMTSNYEAMPYVLIEALHAGLPIVASNVGGTDETLRNGENGFRLPIDASAEDFAKAILEATDKNNLAHFSEESSKLSIKFDVQAMVDSTLSVYMNCFKSKHRSSFKTALSD